MESQSKKMGSSKHSLIGAKEPFKLAKTPLHASDGAKAASDAPFQFETKDVNLDRLLLDPNNYRFLDRKKFKKKAAIRFHENTVQRATLDTLEQAYQLDELKQSILVNGYVPMERIIVVSYAPKPGWYLVVEGNRRVASLKSLLKDEKEGAIHLTPLQRKSFSKVPCAILKSSGSTLQHAERVIMGIRHIAGPKEWGAYQQALLVSDLKEAEGQDFSSIGEMLGISSVEAARRFRAVSALRQMEQDELFSKQAEPSFYRLFHELVSIPEVRSRFGWSADDNAFTDIEKAREFFGLISSDGAHEAKLQSYGDVRKLRSVVGNSKAEESLFNRDEPLSDAIRIGEQGKAQTDPTDLLTDAKNSLAGIGILQAQKLSAADLPLVEELIAVLTNLKNVITQAA
jgi:hypothetical protein